MDSSLMTDKLTTLHMRSLLFCGSLSTEDLIRLANERGIDLVSRDFCGRTVLHYAVQRSRVELIELFLEKGADINIADDDGLTPLLAAARSHTARKLIPLLIKHGADVTVRDTEGRNALHLLSRVPGRSEELDVVLFRSLIAKGISIDVRVKDQFGYQPIHFVSRNGHSKLVELLLDHGANIDAQAYIVLYIPLYMATMGVSSPSVMKVLLERGANIDMTTSLGQTALHGICEEPLVDRRRECIKLLLSAGVDLFAEDYKGKTALALVRQNLRGNRHSLNKPHPDMILMMKAIALKKVCLSATIELKDERILKKEQPIWDYYQDCIRCISKAKSTQIIQNFTFLDLLTKCRCQIVALMRNREFERNFRLCDLNVFSMYACDMLETFERVERYYKSMLEQEEVISEATYGTLPYLVVRKVVRCIFQCKMKRCVSGQKQ